MNYFKILIFIISFQTVSSASYLMEYDATNKYCIEEYYLSNTGQILFLYSGNMNWYAAPSSISMSDIYNGFDYNSTNGRCSPSHSNALGLTSNDFNFLMALSGLLFSAILFFVISNFLLGL